MYPEAQSTQYASAVGGLSAGAQQQRGMNAPKVLDRPMTEIESLTAQMADTARGLRATADRLQSRVDSFMQTCLSAGPEKEPAIEPQPGTLSAMQYWHKQIQTQGERLRDMQDRLAGIL